MNDLTVRGRKLDPDAEWEAAKKTFDPKKEGSQSYILGVERDCPYPGPGLICKVILKEMDIPAKLFTKAPSYPTSLPKRFLEDRGCKLPDDPDPCFAQLEALLRKFNTNDYHLEANEWRARLTARVAQIPLGVLTTKFSSLDEIRQEIRQSNPDMTQWEEPTEIQQLTEIKDELIKFISHNESSMPIKLLTGHRGDGRTSTFKLIKKHYQNRKSENVKTIYFDGKLHGTYAQFIAHLYDSFNIDDCDQDIAATFKSLRDYISAKNCPYTFIVLMLDNFELFNCGRSVTNSVIRDGEIIAPLATLIAEKPDKLRVIIGTSPLSQDQKKLMLSRLALFGEKSRGFEPIRMPSVTTKDIARLAEENTNRFDDKIAKSIHALVSHSDIEHCNSSTMLNLCVATAFCTIRELGLSDELLMTSAERDRKEKLLARIAEVIRYNDLDGACSLIVEQLGASEIAQSQYLHLALMIIALHEDGCTLNTIDSIIVALEESENLIVHGGEHWEKLKGLLLKAINENALAPAVKPVQFPLTKHSAGENERRFKLHDELRISCIRKWERMPRYLLICRAIHAQIAKAAYTQWLHVTPIRYTRVVHLRLGVIFFVHMMASLTPKDLAKIHSFPSPRTVLMYKPSKTTSDKNRAPNTSQESIPEDAKYPNYKKIKDRYSVDPKSLTEIERFIFAIAFLYCEHCYLSHNDSRLYAADELRLELLCRVWHPGWYLPTVITTLSNHPRYLPGDFFFKRHVNAWAAAQRAETDKLFKKWIESSKTSTNSAKFTKQSEAHSEAATSNEHTALLLDTLKKTLVDVNQQVRNVVEWEVLLYERVMYAAARIDDSSLVNSAIQAHRSASVFLGSEKELDQNTDMSLKYLHRQASIIDGLPSARIAVHTLVRRIQDQLEKAPESTPNHKWCGKLETYVVQYLKAASRYADFIALNGNIRHATEIFSLLMKCSWKQLPDLTTGKPFEIQPHVLAALSARPVRMEPNIDLKSKSDNEVIAWSWACDVEGLTETLSDTLSGFNDQTHIIGDIASQIRSLNSEPVSPSKYRPFEWSPCTTFTYSRFVLRALSLARPLVRSALCPVLPPDNAAPVLIHIGLDHTEMTLQELKTNVLSHLLKESLADQNRSSGGFFTSDRTANTCLELATWTRVMHLHRRLSDSNYDASASEYTQWREVWNHHFEAARAASWSGNVSVLTELRMHLEKVRLCWQDFLLERHAKTSVEVAMNLFSELKSALVILNNIIETAASRKLASYEIAGRLLRHEMRFYELYIKANPNQTNKQSDSPISFWRFEELFKNEAALDEDLHLAMRLMDIADCHHRRAEALYHQRFDRKTLVLPTFYIGA